MTPLRATPLGPYEILGPLGAEAARVRWVTAMEERFPVLRGEIREEGERPRRHFDVSAERLEGQIQLIAEGEVPLGERVDDLRTEIKADIAQLDRRVMRLETAR